MIKALFVVATMLALSACTTTKQMDHWQAEGFSRSQIDNVLVVAVTSNQTHRFIFEKEIERRILKSGHQGVTSLAALGDSYPTKEDVEAYVEKHNIDYVMATKLSNIEEEKDYVPESVRTYYTGPYYAGYGSYYGSGNTVTMVREGYTDVRTTMILVTTIFDTKTGEPVWIGRSSTFEPGSVANLAADIARTTWANVSH